MLLTTGPSKSEAVFRNDFEFLIIYIENTMAIFDVVQLDNVLYCIGVGRGGARGGPGPPPIILEWGPTYPLAPAIIHPPFPSISM